MRETSVGGCAMTRRQALKAAGAAALFNIVPAKVLWGAEAPSNMLNRALIGFGAIAHSGNHLAFKGSRLIGLCDPNALHAAEGLRQAENNGWGRVKDYGSFLKLLEDKDVDIVHICTPPHWHGVMSVMAANAGKDIWCEKPMTRTVGEGIEVMRAVAKNKRIFRINTWFRFKDVFYGFGTEVKPIRQVVESGLLGDGPLTCTFGAGQGFNWKFYWSGLVNEKPEPVPETLDWDMWLGPAPWKPYTPCRVGTTFRGYWDYDSGGLGDMAQHYLDPLQYLLCKDETSPVKVEYDGPKQHPEVVGRFNRFTLTYADGMVVRLDGDETLRGEPLLRGSNGICVYPKAKDGKTMRIVGADGVEWPQEKVLEFLASCREPAPQNTDFIECCKERKTFALNERNGFRSSTMFNLAIVSWRLGRDIDFDPVKLVSSDEEANRLLYQHMREPWERHLKA